MDNAQKAIMIGVGLFITIIIISAVMLITSAGQDLMQGSMDELSNISDSLSRQLYSDFAGATLSGAEVIAAVKKYGGQEGLKIRISNDKNNLTNSATTLYYDGTTTENLEKAKKNIGKVNDFVVSTAKYKSEVVMNDNVVERIHFTKQ